MNDWKEGDIVQLKSGGPAMTVSAVNEYGAVHCSWYNATSAKMEQASFQPGMLKPYDSSAARQVNRS